MADQPAAEEQYCELCEFATYDVDVLHVHYNRVHFSDDHEGDELFAISPPGTPKTHASPASPATPRTPDESEWLSRRRPAYTFSDTLPERLHIDFGEALMLLSFLLFGNVDCGMVWRFSPKTTEEEIHAFERNNQLDPAKRTRANFENLLRMQPALERVCDEIGSMSYYKMRFRPWAQQRPQPPVDYSDEDDGYFIEEYESPGLTSDEDEGVGKDEEVHSPPSSVPDSQGLQLPSDSKEDQASSDGSAPASPASLASPDSPMPEYTYLTDAEYAKLRHDHLLREYEDEFERSLRFAFGEDQGQGYSILRTFLNDVKKANARTMREWEVQEEKRRERGWLYLDTREWGDAYRPEVDYEPVLKEENDESEDDEDLIDGLYVRGT